MSKRVWLALLAMFELTWLVYIALLAPLAVAMVTQAPETEVRRWLVNLTAIMPFVLLVSAVTWAAAVFDMTTRPAVSYRLLWCIAVLVAGVVVLPVYYAVHVHRRPTIAAGQPQSDSV